MAWLDGQFAKLGQRPIIGQPVRLACKNNVFYSTPSLVDIVDIVSNDYHAIQLKQPPPGALHFLLQALGGGTLSS